MANYRKAPKLYHIGSKNIKDKKEPTFVIPQRIIQKIFSGIDGNKGNQIKLIMTLLGTIGDGSFAVTEAWITEVCGFSQPAYINARKALVNLGWVTLSKNIMTVNIENILTYDSHMDKVETYDSKDSTYVSHMNEAYGSNMLEAYNPCMYNKEEQIINKEITIEDTVPQTNSNTEIKISRTRDLEYILDLYNLTETDIIKIIQNNNIENADDFVHLLHYETNNINISCGRNILDIQDVVLDYHKYHDYNKFQIGDEFKQDDILTYASKDQSSRVLRWFFKYYNSSVKIETNEQVEILYKIIEDGAKMSTYYFVRNSKRD